MIDIICIVVVVLIIINLNYNIVNIKQYITFNNFKNLIFIIPIITMYLEKDSIGEILHYNTPKSTRKLSETTKKMIASNQKWRCKMCNNMLDASYEVDHIVPLYKGGNNELYNLQALCRNCHGMKTMNDKLNI